MVGRRRKSGRKLAASPQRSWLWGRNVVLETLTAGRWLPLELRLSEGLDPDLLRSVTDLAGRQGIPCEEHPAQRLTGWCGSNEHQGLLAQMPPYPYLAAADVIAIDVASPLFLILDRIQDPYNLGAILRSAEVFGVNGVVLGEREQCEITPHVARSSAGAVNFLRIARTDDLAALVRSWRGAGVRAVAATADGSLAADEEDFRRPTALLIGNEGTGVGDELLAACSSTVRIPQRGRVGSLNAAVATGVLLYEANRQRGPVENDGPLIRADARS